MADYVPIPDSMVDPDAPLTSDLMYRVRDNPIAIAEGATGAPRVQNAALSNDSVNRRTSRTGVASAAGTLGENGVALIEMNNYSFFPDLRGGSGAFSGPLDVRTHGSGSPNAATPSFSLLNSASANRAYDIRWRYLAD